MQRARSRNHIGSCDDVKTGKVKQHELSSNRYMANRAMVVGRILSEDVVEDGVMMAYHFETGGSVPELISKLEPGMRAVTVSLSSSQVTGGLLYPGCIVDVLAAFQLRTGLGDGTKGEAVSTTLLERVEVLAIQGQLAEGPDDEKQGSRSQSTRSVTVTLLLDTKQAEALQVAAANGAISVTMPPRDADRSDCQRSGRRRRAGRWRNHVRAGTLRLGRNSHSRFQGGRRRGQGCTLKIPNKPILK